MEINQRNSVMPSELDQKLCHLLIEQQESQIVDLECELQRTNSKLVEKESELQALKNCVKRLTDFSLTCPTGTLLTLKVKQTTFIQGVDFYDTQIDVYTIIMHT